MASGHSFSQGRKFTVLRVKLRVLAPVDDAISSFAFSFRVVFAIGHEHIEHL